MATVSDCKITCQVTRWTAGKWKITFYWHKCANCPKFITLSGGKLHSMIRRWKLHVMLHRFRTSSQIRYDEFHSFSLQEQEDIYFAEKYRNCFCFSFVFHSEGISTHISDATTNTCKRCEKAIVFFAWRGDRLFRSRGINDRHFAVCMKRRLHCRVKRSLPIWGYINPRGQGRVDRSTRQSTFYSPPE